jgi:hypothetical protein
LPQVDGDGTLDIQADSVVLALDTGREVAFEELASVSAMHDTNVAARSALKTQRLFCPICTISVLI